MSTKTPPKPRLGRSLADLHPDVAAQWNDELNDGITAADVSHGSKFRAWWNCPEGHDPYQAFVFNRSAGSQCPRCHTHRGRLPRLTLGEAHPWLVDQWHPDRNDRTPFDVGTGSSFMAWWICPEGHRAYQQRVSNRARTNLPPAGCPQCGKNRSKAASAMPAPGESLADLDPEAGARWNLKRNKGKPATEVRPHSNTRFWWTCPNGHRDYKASAVQVYTTDSKGCGGCHAEALSTRTVRLAPGSSISERDRKSVV